MPQRLQHGHDTYLTSTLPSLGVFTFSLLSSFQREVNVFISDYNLGRDVLLLFDIVYRLFGERNGALPSASKRTRKVRKLKDARAIADIPVRQAASITSRKNLSVQRIVLLRIW